MEVKGKKTFIGVWSLENMLNNIVARIETLEKEKRKIAQIRNSTDELNIEKIPAQLREDYL